jgi:hypothetical protein
VNLAPSQSHFLELVRVSSLLGRSSGTRDVGGLLSANDVFVNPCLSLVSPVCVDQKAQIVTLPTIPFLPWLAALTGVSIAMGLLASSRFVCWIWPVHTCETSSAFHRGIDLNRGDDIKDIWAPTLDKPRLTWPVVIPRAWHGYLNGLYLEFSSFGLSSR